MVTIAERQQIEAQGFGKTGDVGGQPKITYYTPDGRVIRAMPDMHEYALKDAQGKVIEQGLRDANLDKGWLSAKPVTLQKYCGGCDKWHPTDAEVKECIRKKAVLIAKHTRQGKKDLAKGDGDRISKVESDVADIKDMLRQLLEKK